jgi:hypothetical protein
VGYIRFRSDAADMNNPQKEKPVKEAIPCTDDVILLLAQGVSHDQADAEWIGIRTQLRGHNDTPFGRPALGWPSGRPGSGHPSGVFCMFKLL